MNKILQNTHKQNNIYLLKVRDYFFNKAKFLDRWMFRISFFPVIITVFTLILGLDNDFFDMLIGLFSIALWVVDFFIQIKIDKDVDISNQFREQYDIQVLNHLTHNLFSDRLTKEQIEGYTDKARRIPYSSKYEIWYEEVFSEPTDKDDIKISEQSNTICCQADNLIYGAHVYERTAQYHRNVGIGFIISIVILGIVYYMVQHNVLKLALIMVSVYGALSLIIERFHTARSAGERNRELINLIKSEKVKDRVFTGDTSVLRELQDTIVVSRKDAVFVPNPIRKYYLREENNPFYIELDDIKNFYYKSLLKKKPSCAKDIETFDMDGNVTGTLQDLHEKLYGILLDITAVWDKEDIHYVLDGGSLLGAAREKGKFIFWDDDIDIAVPCEQLEKAKEIIKESLSDRYVIQDYSEEYYSPRLSNFRIRDINTIITEKDSDISERYAEKGIFIDVYVYSPILKSVRLDALFRRLMIHPINRKIKEIEFKQFMYGNASVKGRQYNHKFLKIKKHYLHRVEWYLQHANNRDFWCYAPNYLNFIPPCSSFLTKKIQERFWIFKKPQPYIEADALWGVDFELKPKVLPFGVDCSMNPQSFKVPNKPDCVLRHCYGDYEKSPYEPVENLYDKTQHKYLFSKSNAISNLKHIKTVKYI